MFKKILTFSFALFLCACAGRQVKQIPPDVREYKKVNYFTNGRTQAAFKVVGQMNEDYLEGVLRIKKIGEQDYDVMVMTGASYRVLHAVVSPEGVAYRYLFKDTDTAVVRGRITQFLNVLVSDVGVYKSRRIKDGKTTVTYQGKDVKTRLLYTLGAAYPYAAQSVTLLNTGELFYNEYAPADAQGEVQIPHALTYKDGNITLDMTLISVR
ncbi:MAG: hypothetical protein ACI351_03225 [Candidatus Avelusimicrobium sp.]|uniref:hypothetical protein n=1 Tax=Candidatus Avelusimicrobium sp. TaxID=3048833 RepID=UPI003F0A6E1E